MAMSVIGNSPTGIDVYLSRQCDLNLDFSPSPPPPDPHPHPTHDPTSPTFPGGGGGGTPSVKKVMGRTQDSLVTLKPMGAKKVGLNLMLDSLGGKRGLKLTFFLES